MMNNLAYLIDNPDYRNKVMALEHEIKGLPQIEFPVTHYKTNNGLYGRALFIPKGAVLTGKIHKHEHISVLLEGELSVLLPDGVKRLTAPEVFISPPGVKRAAYAHRDSVWLTVHTTTKQDIEDIEDELVTESYEGYLAHLETLQIGKE